MRRVMIIGSAGSGKSTLARSLSEVTALPAFHMDCVFWKHGWVESTDEELKLKHDAILKAHDAWIIDGNYSRTMAPRLERADTIIFLDMPRWLCMFSVLHRYWKGRGKTRPDIAPGCPEKLDWAFLKWVWDYPRRSRPKQQALISSLRETKCVHVFTNRTQLRDWLEQLTLTKTPETNA